MSLQRNEGGTGADSSKNFILRLRQREISSTPLGKQKNHAWDLCHKLASDDKFKQELKIGKYSRYAINHTGPQLFAVLQAVTEWGGHCDPSLEKAATDDNNEERRNALNRVIFSIPSLKIPVDLGEWADELTASDVFGVLWLVRGISVRESSAEGGIGTFSYRAYECVQPLLDLVHGKPSHYRLEGMKVHFSRSAAKERKCSSTELAINGGD